jgi:hypothetical protein
MNKEIRACVKQRARRNLPGRNISFVVTKHHNTRFETKVQRLNKICWKIIHFIDV